MKQSRTKQCLRHIAVILIATILPMARGSAQTGTGETDGEYSITIEKGEINLVKHLVIVEHGQGHIARREGDKFTHRGPRPEMIYAFPIDTTRGFTYKEWTGSNESTLELQSPTKLNIKVHILYAPDDIGDPNLTEAKDRINKDISAARDVWASNGFGLTFGEIVTVDDRNNSSLKDCIEFACDDDNSRLIDACSLDDEYLHIFYVKDVDGNDCAGYVCGHPNTHCVLAYGREPSLLVHEIGHTFGLNHPEIYATIWNGCREEIAADLCNVMWDQCISPRKNFSLGQIIQSYMSRYSSLNLKCASSSQRRRLPLLSDRNIECTGDGHIPSIAFGIQNPCQGGIADRRSWKEDLVISYLYSNCHVNKGPTKSGISILAENDKRFAEDLFKTSGIKLDKNTLMNSYPLQLFDSTYNLSRTSNPLFENQIQCIRQNALHIIKVSNLH